MLSWFKTAKKSKIAFVGVCIIILSLVAIAFASNVIKTNHILSDKDKKEIAKLVEEVKTSPEYALSIKEDADAPFKILEAKVKEISKVKFERLTGKNTDNQIIISVPEVKFLNTSDKTINKIVFMTRDLSAKRSKGLVIRALSIAPGETYTLSRKQFVPTETIKVVDESGEFKEITKSEIQHEKFWLPFSDKTQLQVSVAVTFEDGKQFVNNDPKEEK